MLDGWTSMSLEARGDRWHSGFSNHFDTTQGAQVADCREGQWLNCV